MLIDFDADSATVRLDEAGFDALLDCAGSPDLVGDPAASLALASGRLDPAMSAIFNPEVGVKVELADFDSLLVHRIWGGDVWAAYLLGEQPMRLFADARTFLPAGLARLLDIRPTNVAERTSVEGDVAQIDDLFDGDAARRQAALRTLTADRAWRITSTAGDESRQVVMSDSPGGLRLWDRAEGTFEPVTNTLAFRILTVTAPVGEPVPESEPLR